MLQPQLIAQLCPTLCDPIDCNLPGSFVHGILQAKNTGVGCHFLLQEIFVIQESRREGGGREREEGGSPALQAGSLPLSHPWSPMLKPYVEAQSQNVTLFGDRAFTEVIKLKWGH